jgi:hypothetical protein
MTENIERHRSRVEIDARARTTRLALERNAVTFREVPRQFSALELSIAELWRRAFTFGAKTTASPARNPSDISVSGPIGLMTILSQRSSVTPARRPS